MSFKSILVSLLMILAIHPAFAESHLEMGVKSEMYYSGLSKEMDFNMSHFWMEFNKGDVGYRELLNFSKASQGDVAFQIRLQVSSLPYWLDGKTQEKVEEKALYKIRSLVDRSLAANPMVSQLPPHIVRAMREDLVDQFYSQQQAIISDRISQIRRETSIQEISVGLAKKLSPNTVTYVKLGKGQIHSTGYENYEEDTIVQDRAKRSGGVVGTGFISFGYMREIDEGIISTELVVYKARMPFVNVQEYVARVVNLDEENFEDQKEVYDLNSAMLKFSHIGDDYKIGFSISRNNLVNEETVEGTFWAEKQITDKDKVQFTYFKSNNSYRSGLDSSTSVTYTHKLNKNYSVFGTAEVNKGFNNPYTAAKERDDYEKYSLGVKWEYDLKSNFTISSKAEVAHYTKGVISKNKVDPYIGLGVNYKYKLK